MLTSRFLWIAAFPSSQHTDVGEHIDEGVAVNVVDYRTLARLEGVRVVLRIRTRTAIDLVLSFRQSPGVAPGTVSTRGASSQWSLPIGGPADVADLWGFV
jgi:hypothetical protein